MSGLSLGLISVSFACLARAAGLVWLGQVGWPLAAVAALAVFVLQPASFRETAVWALAGVAVWILDRGAEKPLMLLAGVAGFLAGTTTPYLDAVFGATFNALPSGAAILAMCLALAVGLGIARISGGAMALFSAALPLGLFGVFPASAAIFSGVVIAVASAPARPLISITLLLATSFSHILEFRNDT